MLTSPALLQECGRKITDEAEIAHAVDSLLPEAQKLWDPIQHWSVRRVRTGVRALPPRTEAGAMPLAGKLESGLRYFLCHTFIMRLCSHIKMEDHPKDKDDIVDVMHW